MKDIQEAELKKGMELRAAIEDTLKHAIKQKMEGFEQSAENREIKYLEEVRKRYLVDHNIFVRQFIGSEVDGKAYLTMFLENLENPQYGFHKDSELLDDLKKFVKDIRRHGTSAEDYVLCTRILRELEALKSEDDVNKCGSIIDGYIRLLKEKCPDNLQHALSKQMEYITALTRYKLALGMLRLMLSKLRTEKDDVNRVLGDFNESYIDEMMRKDPEHFKDYIQEKERCFTEPTGNNMKNLEQLSESIERKKLKNAFLQVLKASGREDIAEDVMGLCDKKGRANHEVVNLIVKTLDHLLLTDEQNRIRLTAIKVLKDILTEETKSIERLWERERKEVDSVLAKRTVSLKEKFSKELEELEKDKRAMDRTSEELAVGGAALSSIISDYRMHEKTITEHTLRANEISRLINAAINLQDHVARGKLAEFPQFLEDCARNVESDYFVKAFALMRSKVNAAITGQLSSADFNDYLTKLKKDALTLTDHLLALYSTMGSCLGTMADDAEKSEKTVRQIGSSMRGSTDRVNRSTRHLHGLNYEVPQEPDKDDSSEGSTDWMNDDEVA